MTYRFQSLTIFLIVALTTSNVVAVAQTNAPQSQFRGANAGSSSIPPSVLQTTTQVPLSIEPISGHWNYPSGFRITNNNPYPVKVQWLLDCWTEWEQRGVCEDVSDEATIDSGKSIVKGFGEICAKWQLDLSWQGGEWGGVAEVPVGCDQPPARVTCDVYAIRGQNSVGMQLSRVSLAADGAQQVGPLQGSMSFAGLAIDQVSKALYVLTNEKASLPGWLFSIDPSTGVLRTIGKSQLVSPQGLAFRRTDRTLWTWSDGQGLAKVNISTGAASVEFASDLSVSDVAWSSDGSHLYVVAGNQLWMYRPQDHLMDKLEVELPNEITSIFIRPDGMLMLVASADRTVLMFDPAQLAVKAHYELVSVEQIVDFDAWAACGNPSAGGEATLITNITLDKTEVCTNETIHVAVQTLHPENDRGIVDVNVNGGFSALQTVQFNGYTGTRPIFVTATTPEGHIDAQLRQVEVIPCAGDTIYPQIVLRPSLYGPNIVDFDVLNASNFTGATFIWNYGDGTVVTQTYASTTHDYSEALLPTVERSTFQATLTVRRTGRQDVSTDKTVTVMNLYAQNRRRGFITPPVQQDAALQPVQTSLQGQFSLRNLEAEPLTFDTRTDEFQFCDSKRDGVTPSPISQTLILAAKQSTTVTVNFPLAVLSPDVCGVGVHLAGQTESGLPSYAHAYFQIKPNPLTRQTVANPVLKEVLRQIVEQKLLPNTDVITEQDLKRLWREGKIISPTLPSQAQSLAETPAWNKSAGQNAVAPLSSWSVNSNPVVGNDCSPGESSGNPGIVCAPSSDPRNYNFYTPYIPNARKGDVLLTPLCGQIGSVLNAVDQVYAHEGLMVDNFYNIRHSTVDQLWLTDVLGQPVDGIVSESYLRWSWPGPINQSVGEAFYGGVVDLYGTSRFVLPTFRDSPARCSFDTPLAYPLVLKPVPARQSIVRPALIRAAEMSKAENFGPAHYRLGLFSKGDGVEDPSYNSPAGLTHLPAGSRATISTVFIWEAMRAAGVEMEGAGLEPGDAQYGGANIACMPKDGLYCYSSATRRRGLDRLYYEAYTLVKHGVQDRLTGSWLDDALATSAATIVSSPEVFITVAVIFSPLTAIFLSLFGSSPYDNFANQVANCFAFDFCSEGAAKSKRWQEPGDGITVSPDNFLAWDMWADPTKGPDGVYGHNERSAYYPFEFRRKYEWQNASGHGTLRGRVTFRGAPVQGTNVSIPGADDDGVDTNADGDYRIDGIPATINGWCAVARAEIEGQSTSDRHCVVIPSGGEVIQDFVLPDLRFYREVLIQGPNGMYIQNGGFLHATRRWFNIDLNRQLNPKQPAAFPLMVEQNGDLTGELRMTLQLQSDQLTVVGTGYMRMYEDGKLQKEVNIDFTLLEDESKEIFVCTVSCPRVGGGGWDPFPSDGMAVRFIATNARQVAPAVAFHSTSLGSHIADDLQGLRIDFPPDAFAYPTIISATSVPIVAMPLVVPGTIQPLQRLEIQAVKGGQVITQTQRPYQIQLVYSKAALQQINASPESVEPMVQIDGKWQALQKCSGCSVINDVLNHRVTINLIELGDIGLMARTGHQLFAPVTLR